MALSLVCGPSRADTPARAAAEAEIQATGEAAAKGGIQAVGDHVENLERVLAEGAGAFPSSPSADGSLIVLTDGRLETLAVLLKAAKGKEHVAVAFNPYPSAAFYLALYYNEVHKPQDALRVIDAGMKLSTAEGLELGEHMPALYTERASAFASLKRFQDAFDVCDKGLKLGSASKMDQARLYRCRGFDLTELNRLDEAQISYEESIKLQPDNALAKRELDYIARVKAGGKTAPPEQLMPAEPPKPANPPI